MPEIPVPDLDDAPTPHGGGGGLLRRIQPLLTLAIAFTAIALALWEGVENRRHNRMSVQPRLGADVDAGRDSASEYVRLSVESTGLGPAVIRVFRVYLDGRPLDTSTTPSNSPWSKVVEAVTTPEMQVTTHAFGSGYYFPAGRQQLLFEARQPRANPATHRPLSDILNHVAVQICYCSVYQTACDEVLLATTRLKAVRCPD